MKNFIILVSIIFLNVGMYANAYFFGLKSADNSVDNILRIESAFDMRMSVISFIYDERSWREQAQVQDFEDKFGLDRIYHITLSPILFSAREVADGAFDRKYRSFFKMMKSNELKVIFRTMHEMNGGWYPWSGSPEDFKEARRHIYDISREEGLTKNDILFDWSVNHRDMPFMNTDAPSQEADLLRCTRETHAKQNCITFEDYYPGDEYVDVVGFSFYNWGKGNSDRKWYTPHETLNDPERKTLERLRVYEKPLIVDEVATSAIWYTQLYDEQKSKRLYEYSYDLKNQWLEDLSKFLINQKDIIGAIYFNVDFTNGLQSWQIGEADWSAINMNNGKVYTGIFDLYNGALDNSLKATAELFGEKILWKTDGTPIIYQKYDGGFLFRVRNLLEDKIGNVIYIKKILSTLETKISHYDNISEGQAQLLRVIQVLIRYYN